jgi:hypothetical protein
VPIKLARWDFIEISGIVIECAIFACAVYLVYNIRMQVTNKAKVLLLFGTRGLYVLSTHLSLWRLLIP